MSFVTSSTGAIGSAGSITLTFPAGTGFIPTGPGIVDSVTDTSIASQVGRCVVPNSGTVVSCAVGGIRANDTINVALGGVANPGSSGPYTLTVSTSSATSNASDYVLSYFSADNGQ